MTKRLFHSIYAWIILQGIRTNTNFYPWNDYGTFNLVLNDEYENSIKNKTIHLIILILSKEILKSRD